MRYKGIEYTKNDIEQAINDMYNQKYQNKGVELHCRDFDKFYLLFKNQKFPVKQVWEVVLRNKNIQPKNDTYNSESNATNIREILENLGYEIKYIDEKVEENSKKITKNKQGEKEMKSQPAKNQILYGPPGTGKTYNTVVEAMKILKPELFYRYQNKPTIDDYKNWYKNISKSNEQINKIFSSLEKFEKEVSLFDVTNEEQLKTYRTKIEKTDRANKLTTDNYISPLCDNYLAFYKDFKYTYYDLKKEFDTLKEQGRIEFVTFHQSYSYEEFVEGIKPNLNSANLQYVRQDGIFKLMCKSVNSYSDFKNLFDNGQLKKDFKTTVDKMQFEIIEIDDNEIKIKRKENGSEDKIKKENFEMALNDMEYLQKPVDAGTDAQLKAIIKDYNNYPKVLIIDEINRGNISKIFGELITLIEPDKRLGEKHELKVKLPYSQDEFGVPSNLYIIGTMNTADKSLALLDVALRRRFEFKPMYPMYDLENLHHSDFLKALNKKIYDDKKSADYLIGHSYFMSEKEEPKLENILNNKVIPLLMEYYNGKIEKVQKIIENVETDEKKIYTVTFNKNYSFDEGKTYYYLQVSDVKKADKNNENSDMQLDTSEGK